MWLPQILYNAESPSAPTLRGQEKRNNSYGDTFLQCIGAGNAHADHKLEVESGISRQIEGFHANLVKENRNYSR